MSASRMLFCGFIVLSHSGCVLLTPKKEPDAVSLSQIRREPLKPDEAQEMLGEVGNNFIYGQGVGETAITVGSVAIFPPFAFAVLGNAALSLSGYEPLGISTVLPDEEKSWWRDTYDSIASGPGRLIAAIAGEEYRSKAVAKEMLQPYLSSTKSAPAA